MKLVLFSFFAIVLFHSSGIAQENDFGVWTQLSLEKKITPRFSLEIREALRTEDNSTRIFNHYSQAIVSYKLSKRFDLNFAYRNSQKFKFNDEISYRSRFQFDLIYKIKMKRIKFEFQERIQTQYSDINRKANWQTPKNTYRSRLTISYDFGRKFTPFFYYELFYHIGNVFDNQRYRLGIDYDFDKHHSMTIFYMLDQEINKNNPLSTYAIGLSYKFAF